MLLDSRAYVERQLHELNAALPGSALDGGMRQRAGIVAREVAGHLRRRGLPGRCERTPGQLWAAVETLLAERPELAEDAAVGSLRRLAEFYMEQPEGFAWDWTVQVHDDGVQDGELEQGVLVEEWVACWRTAHGCIAQLCVHGQELEDETAEALRQARCLNHLIDALFDGHHTVLLDLAQLAGVDDEAALGAITRRQVLRSHRDHSLGLVAIDTRHPGATELLAFLAGNDEGAVVCMLGPAVNWETWAAWLDELLDGLQVRGRLKIRELCDSRCWQRLLSERQREVVLLDDLWEYVPWLGVINGDQIDGSILLYSRDRGRLFDFLEEESVPVD